MLLKGQTMEMLGVTRSDGLGTKSEKGGLFTIPVLTTWYGSDVVAVTSRTGREQIES